MNKSHVPAAGTIEAGRGPGTLPALTGAATPTMVVTTPEVETFRMMLFHVSLTKTLPAPSTATPEGE